MWLLLPSTLVALALVVVGLLFVVVESQSPSRLYWTGDTVTGTDHGGIVYYRVDGEKYTVDDPGPVPAHDVPVTVYVDPDDPGEALVDRPVRWVDAGAVLVWFVAAVVCLVAAAVRRAVRRRRHPDADPDWAAEFLDRERHRDGRRP